MEKTITFNIPKGYVIDKENSTADNIVLKLVKLSKPKTWEEYCRKMEGKDSYYINSTRGGIISSKFGAAPIVSEFEDKEDTEAFAAYSILLKLRKEWIGKWKPDWTNMDQLKYTIFNQGNRAVVDISERSCHSLSFPTKEMRDEFFDCFKDYIEQAKTLI